MSIKIAIVDCGSTKVPYIREMLDEHSVASEIFKLDQAGSITPQFSGIIVSGSPTLLTKTNPAQYLSHFGQLLSQERPMLCICFGHQLLALSAGGEVFMGKEDRDLQTIHILELDPLFSGFGIRENFMEDHCEHVSLPSGYILLGKSTVCETEAMRHATKPLYGVQFHPEVSAENGKKLFYNFIHICKA